MLATTWSKPSATKAVIGKMIASTLPPTSVAASVIHTARQTSQLQPTARSSCSRWFSVTALPMANAPNRA